jgi:hypothetical protein
MRFAFALILCAFTLCGALSSSTAQSLEPRMAPVARGLLPESSFANAPVASAPAWAFAPDPAGGYSRVVFETDEDPDFKIIIRDYAFPPGQGQQALRLPAGAMLHFVSGRPGVAIADAPLSEAASRAFVPPGAKVEVTTQDQRPAAVRALTLEAK